MYFIIPVRTGEDPNSAADINQLILNDTWLKSEVDRIDDNKLGLFSDQDISGIKTFTSNMRSTATPTNPLELVTKLYIDETLNTIIDDRVNTNTILDWNTATNNGTYYGEDALNSPISGNLTGTVLRQSSLWIIQKVYPFEHGTTDYMNGYMRICINGTWDSWKKITPIKENAQTIEGTKTFSSIPIGPSSDPTDNNELTRKLYVDNKMDEYLTLTGDETITGVKTFESIPLGPNFDPTLRNELARKAYADDVLGSLSSGATQWEADSGNRIINKDSKSVRIKGNSPSTGSIINPTCRGVPLLCQTLGLEYSTAYKTATVAVGTNPQGAAFDGTHMWVVNHGTNNVSKIDISTNTVVATVTVGTNPYGAAFDGTHMWVANVGSNNVSKIQV